MSIEAYLNPDFTWPKKLIFLLAALGGLFICSILIFFWVKMAAAEKTDRNATGPALFHSYMELFYEMIISATSVMSFACAYVIINHVYSLAHTAGYSYDYFRTFIEIMDNWKDFVLLILICTSCVLNTILDKLIIPLKKIAREDKATVRMLAMFYVIIILLFLNVIGDESEYSPVMIYYLGLMVGRFVYFDASFLDFLGALKNMFFKLPLLVLGMALSGLLCYFGFSAGYLLERNYFIVGIFYTHLFLLLAVFIIKLSHVLELVVKVPKKEAPQKAVKARKKKVAPKRDDYEYFPEDNRDRDDDIEDFDDDYYEDDDYPEDRR
ncbi:hypothetical protein [Butyrivibrio sp. MC2021]|uniref:hypothetical protein n=1 Tax=Butyrivibrio sp. MC2021 TaxID=1408306 RepID=UPI00047D327C|nr:hypothetical protein [Butyrivibrio sp. MC2021]